MNVQLDEKGRVNVENNRTRYFGRDCNSSTFPSGSVTYTHVSTEMSLYVLAYNLKRVIKLLGMPKTLQAMRLLGA